jgi:hypothetical protein
MKTATFAFGRRRSSERSRATLGRTQASPGTSRQIANGRVSFRSCRKSCGRLPGRIAYNAIVSALFHQFVAIATSVLLALPPGSCWVLQRFERDDRSPVQAECCCTPTDAATQSQPTPEAPVPPRVKCCCAQDAPLPEKSVKPFDVSLSFAALSDLFVFAPEAGAEDAAAISPLSSNPRLHVLQCVWRC